MEEPRISIIIPVYNATKYLERCIKSIEAQTLQDIEIIAVDDGSKDGSLKLLREYAQKDTRLKVISQLNGGQSSARNNGIEHASAPYIMFVDADDWMEKETCERAYRSLKQEQADVVFWSYIREYEGRSLPKMIFHENCIFHETACRMLHRRFLGLMGGELSHPEQADAIVTVWGKLYKAEIIRKNNIKFEDLKKIGTCEDGLFNLYYFGYVKKAVYLNEAYYHYNKISETAYTRSYKGNLYEGYKQLFLKMETYIKSHVKEERQKEYLQALSNRRAMSIIGIGLTECIKSNPKNHRQRILYLKKILKDESYHKAYQDMPFKYFPLHWRLYFWFARHQMAAGVYGLSLVISRLILR